MLINKIKIYTTLTETETKVAINTVIFNDVSQSEFFNNVSRLAVK